MNSPQEIFSEFLKAKDYKLALGSKGLYEQNKINERFFIGDQWSGAKCGNERPLVRHNLIKRIGDYKMSVLLSSEAKVVFSADGVPNTINSVKKIAKLKKELSEGKNVVANSAEEQISLVVSALNDYRNVTAERLKFSQLCEKALRNAYISGTGIIYTYWEPTLATGLYADAHRTTAIKGDIISEVLDVENVYFGDERTEDIQKQPYIIIASELSLEEARRMAIKYGASQLEYEKISPDKDSSRSQKVTVLTKLFKEWDELGDYRILAKIVTKDAVIRDTFDIGVRMYPLAKFCWETRKNCIYGDSEITYLIPNQIAINRMITSGVWSAMSTGMPTLVVNGDIVDGEITNDPGQIIKVYGTAEDTSKALHYVTPPDYSGNFTSIIDPLIENTLSASGATSAALGDVEPQNTSAIQALRTASMLPLRMLKQRYFGFLEEISRIWAEFWISLYGERKLKIQDENGTWYMEFSGEDFKNTVLSCAVDIGESDTFDATLSISVLDKLLDSGHINLKQYLRRLPKGLLPDTEELIRSEKTGHEG